MSAAQKRCEIEAARRRTRLLGDRANSFENWDHQYLSRQATNLYSKANGVAGIYAVGGTGYLMFSNVDHALAFLLISASGWACLAFWNFQGQRGLPVFPVLAAQLTFLNSLALLTGSDKFNDLAASTINISAMTVAIFLTVLSGGWWLGARVLKSRPSVWNITPSSKTRMGKYGLSVAMPLLLFGIVFQVSLINGSIYQLLPGQAVSFLPTIVAFAGASCSLGSFLGGLAVAHRPLRTGAILFWTTFILLVVLFLSSMLLSAAESVVFACAIGLGFGSRRIPWGFLITAVLVVGFLNEGKAQMRERYWNASAGGPSLQLSHLPEFFEEWGETSLSNFQDDMSDNRAGAAQGNADGNPTIITRLDNFQNLTFIVDTLERGTGQLLYGKTYSVIPPLLIPRFLWPDKPRTQEGQIMLNLNFGRQRTEEETYTTYIAWGLLPEAVGNFGCVAGACFLGSLLGFGSGMLEVWSARKRLLSVEGLVATGLLVQVAISYEMVASMIITSTFQMLVAVIVFSSFLRYWFVSTQRAGKMSPLSSQGTRQTVQSLSFRVPSSNLPSEQAES